MRVLFAAYLLGAGLSLPLMGQKFGDWKTYLSHNEGIGTATRGGQVFTITKGGMYQYDPEFGEVITYSTVNGMSGINPTSIHHAESSGFIVIGYADGRIDYFSDPSEFRYITDINRNTFITQKGINAFESEGALLYIAMESGLAIYNLAEEFPDTDVTQFADNPSKLSVTSLAIFDEKIYVLLENGGFYSAPVDFPNLKDPAIWQDESGSQGLPVTERFIQIAARSGELFGLSDTTVWRFDGMAWEEYTGWDEPWDHIYVTENAFGGSRFNRIQMKHNEGPTYNFFITGRARNVSVLGPNTFGIATGFEGGILFDSWEITNTTPAGPRSNDCVRIAAANGELYIAPIGYNQAFTPTPSALGIYYFSQSDGWQILDRTSGALPDSVSTGFARAWYDQQTERAYLGSWGAGLLELQQGVVENYETCQDGLSVIFPPCNLTNVENTRISGIQMDPQGYLWVSLDFAQDPLMVRTPEGQWIPANRNRLPADDHFTELILDDFGNKWILNNEAGIILYNDQQTPENPADDFSLTLRSGINSGNLPSNDVYSMAKDHDGFVWVGTTQGVTVFYDTYSFTQGVIVDASPPVYQRFPLLKDAIIRSIAVDGGNRKWLGTDDGVYLVSPDGDEIIFQFNVENSPLLSNTVNDIEIDPTTGEVFFATALGLISFQGDATEPASDCSGLTVFPNPVRPEYTGPVTIRGTGAESSVRITTVSGLLVKEIQAEGGTAVWDGRDTYGKRVQSGVYLALSADRNGESGCAGKFVFLGSGNND